MSPICPILLQPLMTLMTRDTHDRLQGKPAIENSRTS